MGELDIPSITVYGWEMTMTVVSPSRVTEEVDAVCKDVLEEAMSQLVPVALPASHPTTLVAPNDKADAVFHMRHAPELFKNPASAGVKLLEQRYRNLCVRFIQHGLGQSVLPLPSSSRAAEAFVTNSALNEKTDPHIDERVTAVFYPTTGQGLVVSHDRSASSVADIERQPSTLVLPARGSFVIFDGPSHPHVGVSFGIDSHDSDETKLAKVDAIHQRFNIVRRVTNMSQDIVRADGSTRPAVDVSKLAADPNLNGERIVISLNYAGGSGESAQRTSLDALLQVAGQAARDNQTPYGPRL